MEGYSCQKSWKYPGFCPGKREREWGDTRKWCGVGVASGSCLRHLDQDGVLSGHLDGVLPGHLDGVLPGHLDGVLPRHLDEVLPRHLEGFARASMVDAVLPGHLYGARGGSRIFRRRGLTVMRGHMAVARGKVPWKLLPCVLNICS